MTHTLLDLFCGTGGFSYGFEAAGLGFETRLGIDLLSVAIKTFAMNHKRALAMPGDIRAVNHCDVSDRIAIRPGELDVIIGGPPCQGFSSIRPNRSYGRVDRRNDLFEEFASFVRYFRPKVFVIENVVGLATFQGGETVQRMEECFHLLGYSSEWRILNAAHFGVPQKRERFIMIGCDAGVRPIFPEPTHRSNSPTIGLRDRSRMQIPQFALFDHTDSVEPAVTALEAISDLPPLRSGEEATLYVERPRNHYQSSRRGDEQVLTLHSSTCHTEKMLEIIKYSGPNISHIPKHLITSGFSSSYSRLGKDEPSTTLTVNFVHPASNRCIHPTQDRALTPREGARIQSFDDSFRFAGTRSQVVRQIGNAVPPVLGKAIARAVYSMINGSSKTLSSPKPI
jgi:DNA (cytosine-5)-methyltransferase 1